MRVRHKIPSIFTLSMVDVLCCSLGCVILLWLLNLREAREHEETAAEQSRLAISLLDRTRTDRDSARARVDSLEAELRVMADARAALRKDLAARLVSARVLESKLKTATEEMATLDMNLLRASTQDAATQRARAADFAGKLAQTMTRLKEVQGVADQVPGLREDARALATRLKSAQTTATLVPTLRTDLAALRKRHAEEESVARALAKEMTQRLQELKDADRSMESLRTARRALERDLALRDKELTQARTYKDRWAKAEERALVLDRRLATTTRSLATLEGEKKLLQGEVGRMRAVVDNRFAGIELTGRRVVFLVDMSGSMNLVAEKTLVPAKWTGVRATVVRLMRSLPDLEKYQVILFSDRTTHPVGGEGRWLDFDVGTSPDRVTRALATMEPKGGTNMYAALKAAFALRAEGLDTIYLLSDGLPNLGEGVDSQVAAKMKEFELGELLGKHIRKTLRTNWNRPVADRPRVRINAIGFFYESPDVGAFLRALARENDGSFVGMSKP